MKEKELRKRLYRYLAGDLNASEEEQFRNLIKDYPEYLEILELHRELQKTGDYTPGLPAEKLSRMRADIVRTLRLSENNSKPGHRIPMIERIRSFLVRPEMAVAALTLIIGFLMGRIFPVTGETMSGQFIRQINTLAAENRKLTDVKNSPYNYSNISFREVDPSHVELNFDVSTHLNMVKEKNDPVVREIIAQALLNSSNVGSELKAISYSESIVDQRVKQALIFSMKKAPIQAVRQKAEETLIGYQNDPELQQSLLDVLRSEESVQMRLIALDYLITNRVAPDSIRKLVDDKSLQNSPAVLFKAKKYLENTF
jgi:hypothetical protein